MSKINKQALQAVASKVASIQGKGVVPIINNKNGIELTSKYGAVPTPTSNEFYDALINLLRSQLYKDGVDISAFSDKLAPFNDTKQWLNGLIQIVGKDLKVPDDGYFKELAFDKIFNPVDRQITTTYGQDIFKKSVREKLDRTIVARAINDGDAIEFVNNIQKKQNDDLAVQLFNDFIDFYKITIGTFAVIEIDTTTNREQRIVKAEKDAIEYLKLPQNVWNETGFIYSRPATSLLVVRDPFINNEIEVYLSANVFNPSYIQTGLELVKIPIYTDEVQIYSVVQDQDKVKFKITVNETSTIPLDGFQVSYATRMFYGMYNVPWLGGIAIIEVGQIIAPTATITGLTSNDPTTIGGTDGNVGANVTIGNFTGQGIAKLNPVSGTSDINLNTGLNAVSFDELGAGTYNIEVYDDATLISTSEDIILTDPTE